jgi:phage terminase large subunit
LACLSIGGLTITPELRKAWREDPLKLQNALWPDVAFFDKQREIIYSVRDDAETFVPAGNMLGKDFVAGFIAVWFFLCHDVVRVITTSVKDDHLRVLWGEINGFISTSRVPLRVDDGGPLICNHHEIKKAIGSPMAMQKSYLRGMVSSNIEGMAGHHAPHTLMIIDEASGVEDVVYTQCDTWARRKLIIGNPNPCTNFFYRGVMRGNIE